MKVEDMSLFVPLPHRRPLLHPHIQQAEPGIGAAMAGYCVPATLWTKKTGEKNKRAIEG